MSDHITTPPPASPPALRPVRTPARLTAVALGLAGAAWALRAVWEIRLDVTGEPASGPPDQGGGEHRPLTSLENAYHLISSAGGITAAICAVLFIVWLDNVRDNARELSGRRPRYSGFWLYAGWLIPLGNLWIPRRIVADAHQDSAPGERLPRSLNVWWALWLLGMFGGGGLMYAGRHGQAPQARHHGLRVVHERRCHAGAFRHRDPHRLGAHTALHRVRHAVDEDRGRLHAADLHGGRRRLGHDVGPDVDLLVGRRELDVELDLVIGLDVVLVVLFLVLDVHLGRLGHLRDLSVHGHLGFGHLDGVDVPVRDLPARPGVRELSGPPAQAASPAAESGPAVAPPYCNQPSAYRSCTAVTARTTKTPATAAPTTAASAASSIHTSV